MRVTRFCAGALLLGFALPGMVLAQATDSWSSMSYDESDGYAYAAPDAPVPSSPSPSDAPAPQAAPAPVADSAAPMYYCPTRKCGSRRCCDGKLADPWTLFPEFESGLTIGGWIESGIYSNAYGATFNGPIGFRDVGDGYTLDQAWIYAEKAVDTTCKTIDWGFRMDYVFGTDGPDTQAFGNSPNGWDNSWDSARDYGSAIPQLYGEIGIGKLTVKAGHFYTIIGYEVVPAPDNFFYSHAYCMYFAEPFTHTGVLATYSCDNDVTLYGGWVAGWDTGFENPNGASQFLGGIGTPIGDHISLTWALTGGTQGAGLGDLYMNSFVVDVTLTEKLSYVFQHDLGVVTNQPGANSQWFGINQYLLYSINDCWGVGTRFEWFCDDDGTRVTNYNGNTGNAGDYYELTAGLNWKPHTNIVVRPELRYDWYNGNNATGVLPFNDGTDREQFSGGVDIILTY